MPEPVKITDEMVKAFVDSYEEGCCNDSSADWCCTRHALARVAPLIAARALRDAIEEIDVEAPLVWLHSRADEQAGAARAAREAARRAE